MKVSDVNLALRDMPATQMAERQGSAAPVKTFHRELTSLSEDGYKKHIVDLVDSINKQGEIVAKRADIKELYRYREMITRLVNETVSNSYIFSKNSAFDSRGRHRIYSMIKKVDTDLDALTQELLKEQADNLMLVDLVDDIRGLLVDIFL